MAQPFSAAPEADAAPRYLLLGEVLRPHALRGEVRVRVLTDYPERIAELEELVLAGDVHGREADRWSVEQFRYHQGYGLLKLAGVDDRNTAETLRGLKVLVTMEEAVPLEADEFYLYQLVGLQVHTVDGCRLGPVRDIIETGANDVYIVDNPEHGDILIPATSDTILETNIAEGFLRVQLPEGLLPG